MLAAHARSFLLLIAAAAMRVHDAAALTVDAASVTLSPARTDSFKVKGRLTGFTTDGADAVEFDLGGFSQTIPIASFSVKGAKIVFKGRRAQAGIATLTIDGGKGRFAAAGKGLALGRFDNPAALRIVTGPVADCATISFTERATKKAKRLQLAAAVPACAFQGVPRADPGAIFVDAPTDVRVEVGVRGDPALDPSSVVLRRLDEALAPLGDPLCALRDDASPESGDGIAADGVFGCRVTLSEPQPARIRLAAQVLSGGTAVLSPSVFVDVVTPLTEAEVQAVIDGQQAAGQVWDAAAAELGDTRKARKRAVAGILDLPGVANAGITGDGFSIFIEYENGLAGGLDLDPVNVPLADIATVARMYAGEREPAGRVVPPSARQPAVRRTRGLATPETPRIGNNKVLVWAPFYRDPREATLAGAADKVKAIFDRATCPRFEVTYLREEQCSLASVGTFADYGTLVLITHAAQPDNKTIAFMSGETSTILNTWFTYAADLKAKRVVVYNGQRSPEKKGRFVFLPEFVHAQIGGRFPQSLIFAAGCTSAANGTMAEPFFVNGALAYLGNTSTTHGRFMEFAVPSFFSNLIDNATSVDDALARVPHRTPREFFLSLPPPIGPEAVRRLDGETLSSRLIPLPGEGRLSYPCVPPSPGLVETIQVAAGPSAHAVGTTVLDPGARYRMEITGETRRQVDEFITDFDAIYCFNGPPGGMCSPASPFPTLTELYFYSQFGDEMPDISELKDVLDFTNTSERPAFDAGHHYTFHFNGTGGRLWVQTWPQFSPDTPETFSGSFTVQLFRE